MLEKLENQKLNILSSNLMTFLLHLKKKIELIQKKIVNLV